VVRKNVIKVIQFIFVMLSTSAKKPGSPDVLLTVLTELMETFAVEQTHKGTKQEKKRLRELEQ
jgi:hypothetical protein